MLPPSSLADTGWAIVAIGGENVAQAEDYHLQFSAGRIHGQAGCNRFSGPYREAIRTLTPGPMAATRMACPEPRMRHERDVLDLLSGPVRFFYPDGDSLVLTGRAARSGSSGCNRRTARDERTFERDGRARRAP